MANISDQMIFDQLRQYEFLAAAHLFDEQKGNYIPRRVTIKGYGTRTAKDKKGQDREVTVVFFAEYPVPMVLNATNLSALGELFDNVGASKGQVVLLSIESGMAFGKPYTGLRIGAAPSENQRPTPRAQQPASGPAQSNGSNFANAFWKAALQEVQMSREEAQQVLDSVDGNFEQALARIAPPPEE